MVHSRSNPDTRLPSPALQNTSAVAVLVPFEPKALLVECYQHCVVAAGGTPHGTAGPPRPPGGAIARRPRDLDRTLCGRVDVKDLPL